MTDSDSSSFSLFLEPFRSKTPIQENSKENENETETIRFRFDRPAPASMKRKREQEANKKELLKMCRPLSIKLDRVSQHVITKMIKKYEHTTRFKKKNRWQKGFVDKRKRTKSEKSVEVDRNSNSPQMTPNHPWGCCRIIPFERHMSRSHRRFSTRESRDSMVPRRSQPEISSETISEPSSKMALREKKLSQENKHPIIMEKKNESLKVVSHNSESPSKVFLTDVEKTNSTSKEDSTFKADEDEFVCRRTIPYIRKTHKPVFSSQTDILAQSSGSKNSSSPKTLVLIQQHTNKEPNSKNFKSSRKEKRNSETDKEYSGCSKTEPFIFKNRPRDRNTISQQTIIDTKSEICKKPSELESEVFEKANKAKAPEPNASKENDSDNIEDDFSWGNSSMWRIKRKHRVRRISSTSSSDDEAPKKKTKNSIFDRSGSDGRKQDSGSSREKVKLQTSAGIRTLCPSTCTNHDHHSSFFNFLFEKPKVISLKNGQVVLEKLEDMVNDPYVIRWRNNMIKLEREEVEHECEPEMEEVLDDPRYYIMYEDGTVSNEALPQEAIYQMSRIPNFPIEEPDQLYKKINSYKDDLINDSSIDVSKCFSNEENLSVEGILLQSELTRENDARDVATDDDTSTNNTLREDVSIDEGLKDDDVLELNKYPKVLLIRLETLSGTLDSEYSSSEIEVLEEKYIDFMMNSNFSYDKQSQSFFKVYKRLHAKRSKEREKKTLNDNNANSSISIGDVSENHAINDTDSLDDDMDEKPLVIAVEAQREVVNDENWATDESSVNSFSGELNMVEKPSACEKMTDSSIDPNSEKAMITNIAKDSGEKVPHDNNSDSTPIEFIFCDEILESETPKEPLFITCKFCKVSFRSMHSFSLHKSDCHLKNKEPMKCEYCGRQYKCRRSLKLHIQFMHRQRDSVDKNAKTNTEKQNIQKQTYGKQNTENKTAEKSSKTTAKIISSSRVKASNSAITKSSSSSNPTKKKSVPAAQKHLSCGVCSVTFDTRESLWDHIYKHTEKELQDAYKDATRTRKDEELRNKIQRIEQKRKDNLNQVKKKHVDPRKESRELANKYAQWKDRILYKNCGNEKPETSRNCEVKQTEEVILSSSESGEFRKNSEERNNIENNSTTSRNSFINSTKVAQKETGVVAKLITMCPCHSNDTSTMVNGDMQIEMVLLCEICQVLFRRRDCFEVHYRVNRLCNMDRSCRVPKLFCSSCRILLNSLPEMRHHLEKHAEVNRQGHVTFLCNICKVMFFGVGSLFYSHWFNHNKDVNFLASRYSFPKLSIVPIMSLAEKVGGQNQKEEYLFVAEYVCKDCKIPFGSEADLETHVCNKSSAVVNNEPKDPKEVKEKHPEPNQNISVRVYCLACQKIYPNKELYDVRDKEHNHVNTPKAQYYCVATTNEQKAYICSRCKTVRMTVDDLKEHWIFHRPWREKFTCANCPDVRSDKFAEIEDHCKRCNKNLQAVCNVSLISATYKCQPCDLHFETSNEWKEHHQVCSGSINFSNTINPSNSEVVTSISSVLSSAIPVMESSGSLTVPLIIPITVTSTIPCKEFSKVPTPVKTSVTPSKINSNNYKSILPKPSPAVLKPTTSTLLERYLLLGSMTQAKPKSKRQVSQDVEVIEILSESSSRSSVTELGIETNSLENADISKDMPLLKTSEERSATEQENPYEIYTSGELQSEYRRKDVSLSKAVVCYPPKRRSDKKNQQLVSRIENSISRSSTPDSAKKTSEESADKTNLAMTSVNPEFESLLTELEDLENGKRTSKSLKDVRRKSFSKELNIETSGKISTKTNEEFSISESGSLSIVSEATSSKSAEKETHSPLPFEVILLPEEENDSSPKSGTVAENKVTKVDINSNKSVADQNSASGNRIESNTIDKPATNNEKVYNKISPNDSNTASIIEEYIEYIMMDEAGSDSSTLQMKSDTLTNPEPIKEASPQLKKGVTTRLRVRPLAELQEIKTYMCDVCGQSLDTKNNFDQHMKAKHSSKSTTKGFLQSSINNSQPPQNKNLPSEIMTEVDYEATLAQNLVRRGAGSPNMDFIPPLLPFSVESSNATSSNSNMSPVPPNLAIPDRQRQSGPPFENQSYDNNTEVNKLSNISFISTSPAPRSGAIQLPERTGGSVLQKRPSGAATRIQNLSNPPRHQSPSVIQHRGLPQTYAHRSTGRSCHSMGSSSRPLTYSPSGLIPVRFAGEKPNSLTCSTCPNYTAKSLAEFSTHLLLHFMGTTTNGDSTIQMVNQEIQLIDPVLSNSPNTSGYHNSPIPASDIYEARSSSNSNASNWQSPARYIYACQLCSFRTESKTSIRLHEKNHMAVAAMRQKNLERLQNRQLVQDSFQVQLQQQQQQRQPQISLIKPNSDSNTEKSPVILYTRVGTDIYQCQLCNNFLFSTQDEFMRHLQSAHKQVRKDPVAEPLSDSDTVCFVCDYCETPQIFESEVNLRKHMNFLHNHICHICKQRCTSRESLNSHVLSHKLDNQTQ